MTQQRPRSFQVNVLPPKGGLALRTFSDLPQEKGITDGIVATAFADTGCNDLMFDGRPDLLQLPGGQVLQAFITGQNGVPISVFYGAVIVGSTIDPSPDPKKYTASARVLLVSSGCRGERFANMDTALIASSLCATRRHPALKYRASDFPASGTVLDTFVARGSLGAVLDQLLEATGDKSFGTGVDPDGFVFFKPNKSVRVVDYESTDYRALEPQADNITTAINWRLEPGDLGQYAGPYLPVDLNYLAVPNPEFHEQYGYEKDRIVPPSAFAAVPAASEAWTSSNFTNPGNAVNPAATAPATRNASGTATFQLNNSDPWVLGVRLEYKLSDDAGVVKLRAKSNTSAYFEITLEASDADEYKEVPLFLPPHASGFEFWQFFRLTALTGGTFELLGFYPLRLDTERLDNATRLIVPEKNPAQVIEEGVIAANAATIRLENAPGGARDSPSAGITWSWTPEAKARTVTNLEVTAYEEDDPALQRVSGYYRRMT